MNSGSGIRGDTTHPLRRSPRLSSGIRQHSPSLKAGCVTPPVAGAAQVVTPRRNMCGTDCKFNLTLLAVSGTTCEHLKTPTVKCRHCNGTGQMPDQRKIGWDLRTARKFARIGLREMATEIGVSSGYLHDLEHGRRNWTPKLIANYNAAVNCACRAGARG